MNQIKPSSPAVWSCLRSGPAWFCFFLVAATALPLSVDAQSPLPNGTQSNAESAANGKQPTGKSLRSLTQRGSTTPFSSSASSSSDIDLFPNITSLGGGAENGAEEPIEWSARYFLDPGSSGSGRLEVTAELADHWHIYSVTQPAGGPTRTTIEITDSDSVSVSGEFQPDANPAQSISSTYNGLTVEEHSGTVRWTAPIRMPVGFQESVRLKVRGLVCLENDANGRCMPTNETLVADLANEIPAPAVNSNKNSSRVAFAPATPAPAKSNTKSKPFRDGDYVVAWTAELVPGTLAPGQMGALRFTAKPDEGFHVYQVATDDAKSATNFVVTAKDGLLAGKPVADKDVISQSIVPDFPPVHYYKGNVTFDLPIKAPADVTAGVKSIKGMIAYQACTDSSCHKPVALKFVAQIPVGDESAAPSFEFASAKSSDALEVAGKTKWVDPITADNVSNESSDDDKVLTAASEPPATSGGTAEASFLAMLGFAFLGGLILNVMPCVLPVVGLKIMGFVSQAGQDRSRVLMLNLVYVLGIMSVFAILAVVAAVSKFGWGQQFTYFEVKLGLTILMFALALSYLGVWEIPAPGVAGGKTSADLQNREGLVGAFSKGVFATILSTPCSGPLLGYILGATLTFSPQQTIAIMLMVGFGMSSPYLLIGAQPKLVSWLPKPGPWMETLKQLMAFLFLGTVAYFFAQFSEEHKVPVFITLIAVWFGCWIIGQVPNWAAMRKRLAAWGTGIVAATLISVGAFYYLKPNDQLAWKDYSESQLVTLQESGKTVLLDFGAKWCATCQVNYRVALNTEATREVLDELGAVAMYADWTDQDDQIKRKLEELNSRSIPLLAIYPAGRPNDPIILRDLVTQQDVIDALRQAGASIDRSISGKTKTVSFTDDR